MQHPNHKALQITWCNKFRFRFVATSLTRCRAEGSIRQAGCRFCLNVLAVNVQPAHVYALVEVPSHMSESDAVALLKAVSEQQVRSENTQLQDDDILWGASYQARIVPEPDIDALVRYITYLDERHLQLWN